MTYAAKPKPGTGRGWTAVRLAAGIAIGILALWTGPAATPAADTVESIDALYRAADALAAATQSIDVFHATPSGWIQSKDFAAAKAAVESGEADQLAKVYLNAGKIVSVQVETFAQSGDWHNLRSYYYYPGGRTALMIELVSSFSFEFDPHNAPTRKELAAGDVIVDARVNSYFDRAGHKLSEVKAARVRSSGRQVTGDYVHLNEPVYMTIAALPFSKWLSGKY